jgi:hypothetical protein
VNDQETEKSKVGASSQVWEQEKKEEKQKSNQ